MSMSDSDALDQLALYMARPGQWNGGDVCSKAADLIEATGRQHPGTASEDSELREDTPDDYVDPAYVKGLADHHEQQKYNGWSNRETWAVALHINNDQGWQQDVHEALREAGYGPAIDDVNAREAGEVIKDNVELRLENMRVNVYGYDDRATRRRNAEAYHLVREDVGSLWRVDWDELGRSFLSDLAEQQ